MAKSYYAILGFQKRHRGRDKIGVQELAKKYHPDLNPNDKEAAEKFKEVNEAYEVLSDPKKRQMYDSGAFDMGGAGGFGGFDFSDFTSGFDDILNFFFSGGRSSAYERPRGEDIQIRLNLTFDEAARGVKKDLSYAKDEQCSSCRGTGAKDGTRFEKCPKCGGTGKVQYVNWACRKDREREDVRRVRGLGQQDFGKLPDVRRQDTSTSPFRGHSRGRGQRHHIEVHERGQRQQGARRHKRRPAAHLSVAHKLLKRKGSTSFWKCQSP